MPACLLVVVVFIFSLHSIMDFFGSPLLHTGNFMELTRVDYFYVTRFPVSFCLAKQLGIRVVHCVQ